MPELLTLGTYEPATKTGPAIWIKAMLGRSEDGKSLLPQADWPPSAVPVIYLPGVSRAKLRAIEECPAELKPLCELQFRGVFWTQTSGKDWTPRAFLQASDGGLGLSLAADSATLGAMKQALEKLAEVPLAQLQGRTLDAGDFHELLAPDPARTVLDWLSDAAAYRNRAGTAWSAFRTVCKDKFGFDPEKTDVTKAGQQLAERQGPWKAVWSRFEENPRLYPGIRDVLRRSKPGGSLSLFFSGVSVYPQDNESAESDLRNGLLAVGGMSEAVARAKLLELEQEHSSRRTLVWASLGEAPLTFAMQHLAELARLSAISLGGADRDAMAALYAESGWRVDDAAMRALAAVRSAPDWNAVGGAISAVYRPWLSKAAENLQRLVLATPLPTARDAAPVAAEPGHCLVFADGLRMDLGQRVAAELSKHGFGVGVSWRWSTVPSVTATAKPAASPVSSRLDRGSVADDFVPSIAETGKNLTADRFRGLLKDAGVASLGPGDSGNPTGTAGWMEIGTIDHRGHSEGIRLASLVEDELRLITDRVAELLAAGWNGVTIVTDHGWLMLPGGLPRVALPRFLVETRWGRCACVKEGASPDCQQHSWHWNPLVSIALAPGIACFRDGLEYAHGGISAQELVTPVITISRPGTGSGVGAARGLRIASLVWNQLTGRVSVEGEGGATVDLRRDATDPTTTMLDSEKPRPIDQNGQAKIYARDEAEDVEAEVVVLDAEGRVLARQRTRIGRE